MVFGKKGIVFTIVALIISAFLLVMFFYMIELPVDHEVEVTSLKVQRVNRFLVQAEDLIRAQAVSSSKIAINEYIKDLHNPSADPIAFDVYFETCLGIDHEFRCSREANFKSFIEENFSRFVRQNLGLDVEFVISDVSLVHASPWDLNVSFSVGMLISMDGFQWNLSYPSYSTFSILGFKDPVEASARGSMGSYRPAFDNLTVISYDFHYKNLSGDWFEMPSKLNIISIDKHYFEYEHGISFLNRLRGNFSSYEDGIVRVQLPIYDNGDVVYSGASNLDWQYWQDDNTDTGPYGVYNFTEAGDKITVLGIDPENLTDPDHLNNTLHNARVPVDLAQRANVSDASYFYTD